MSRGLVPTATDIDAATDTSGSVAEAARRVAPVVWLIGKVQSGKTSVVRAITHASDAEIGNGFAPCTKSSRVFDFPREHPILRFLDTRGLGEVAYEPAEDLAFAERQAHLLLVTMRAMDMAQEAILDVVRAARKAHPNWPIVVAQTSLHEGYETGNGHVLPYPFDTTDPDFKQKAQALPADLLRCLTYQRRLFASMVGAAPITFVPYLCVT